MLTYRILDGDKSDNINGVMGAGLKSLIKYIPELTEDKDFTAMDLINFVNKLKEAGVDLSFLPNNGKDILGETDGEPTQEPTSAATEGPVATGTSGGN